MNRIALFLSAATIVLSFAGISAAQNYKIKQTTSLSGQTMTSTVYVKGARKRTESSGIMGMGADVATIEQCDLKRTVQVNDKKKLYFSQPFDNADGSPQPTPRETASTTGRAVKGGVITMTSDIRDTGERKQMFGINARRVKTTMTSTSSPDACTRSEMSIETDGWYIDLPEFACPVSVRDPMQAMTAPRNGCVDQYSVKSTGGGKLGFPLQFTQTMRGPDGSTFTQSMETVEFTRSALDDALFTVPASYTLAGSSQDLYGRPDYSAMMQNTDDGRSQRPMVSMPEMPASPKAKRPGVIRIGVLAPANRSPTDVSSNSLQSYLASRLSVGNTEAIAVSSEAEARASECDYLLATDVTKLKESAGSKIGGIFGKVTNTDVSSTKSFDVQVDFTLRSLKGGGARQVQSGDKVSGDAQRAAQSAIDKGAAAVLAAAK